MEIYRQSGANTKLKSITGYPCHPMIVILSTKSTAKPTHRTINNLSSISPKQNPMTNLIPNPIRNHRRLKLIKLNNQLKDCASLKKFVRMLSTPSTRKLKNNSVKSLLASLMISLKEKQKPKICGTKNYLKKRLKARGKPTNLN